MMLLVRVMGWQEPEKVKIDLGIPELDAFDRWMLSLQAEADREERENARKAAGNVGNG